jgi:undecaprenyl-diphosphatase
MPAAAAGPVRARTIGSRLLVALVLALLAVGVVRATAAAAATPVSPAAVAGSVALPRPITSTATVAAADEAAADEPKLSPLQAVVLGVVEGVTEFLPISSTGHLLVTSDLLGIGTGSDEEKDAADAYAIVIQAGAILAVAVLYWRRLLSMVNGLIGRDPDGRRVLVNLAIAAVPGVLAAVAFEGQIKGRLFGPVPVLVAWAVGGVALLWLSRGTWWDRQKDGGALEAMGWRQAAIIGVAQCLALWPGTSRSLVVLVAGILVGLSLAAAVEFSFLLGLVILSGATLYDGARNGDVIIDQFGVAAPVIGFVTAFVAAVIAVRWMVGYLQNHSLAIFGWYRLGVAGLTVVLLVTGVITT